MHSDVNEFASGSEVHEETEEVGRLCCISLRCVFRKMCFSKIYCEGGGLEKNKRNMEKVTKLPM